MTSPELPFSPDDAFVELGKIVLGDEPLEHVLERIMQIAKRMLPVPTEASVTLISDDQPVTVAFTGDALALDERQYETHEGPCLEAARSGQIRVIADTNDEPRWEHFVRQAAGAGVRSTLSLPLPMQRQVRGALNFYSTSLGAFTDDVVELAQTFAGHAAVAVTNAQLFHATAALAEQMQQAMASRAVIEQAKGIVMRDRGCGADEAFEALVQLSQESHVKLRDVAQRLVDQVGSGG